MKKTNGKYVLIFFLLAWVGLIVSIYIYESRNESKITFHTESKNTSRVQAYSNQELKELAKKNENSQIDNSIDSFPEELFVFEEVEVNTNDQGDTDKPVLDTTYFRDQKSSDESMCGDFKCYTSGEFLDLYNNFERNQNLNFLEKYIYQIEAVDSYINQKAQKRGYQQRGFADESEVVWFENVRTRPEVRDAYISLRNEMLNEGIRLHFVSGYRSSTSQRAIFKSKMGLVDISQVPAGIHDTLIDQVLVRSAIPGYSKHHSGYAVDFGCGNNYLVYSFAETECYGWMSENNFENTKKHGFIPSYPEGVASQGPNPEPWEYVWVGVENI